MIQIIESKRYNTEKSTLVFEFTNGIFISDFRYRCHSIYRTQNGNWFVHHVGGALSDIGDRTHGRAFIEPIGIEEAYNLLEIHSDDSKAQAAIDLYFSANVVDA